MRKIQMRRFRAAAGGLVLAALVVAGCQIIADVRDVTLYPDGGTGGSNAACVVADCPAPASPCQAAICVGSTCGVQSLPMGTVVPEKAAGSCTELVCDGKGAGTTQGRATGTACSNDAGAGVCNDGGVCVGCNGSADCDGGVCMASRCVAGPCSDGMQDGDETGVDCGGSCSPCADGRGCNKGSDCTGGTCNMGTCCTPKTCAALGATCGMVSDGCGGMLDCNNGKKDGTETDVDCGGMGDMDAGVSPCPACPKGGMCSLGSDCSTTLCQQGVCCATACSAQCMQCNLTGSIGTCSPTPYGQNGPGCLSGKGKVCDGTGQCKGLHGAMCTTNAECLSGVCVIVSTSGACM